MLIGDLTVLSLFGSIWDGLWLFFWGACLVPPYITLRCDTRRSGGCINRFGGEAGGEEDA